jgi:hypothetical protein
MHNAETRSFAAFIPWVEMQAALEDASGLAHVEKARAHIGFILCCLALLCPFQQ